MLNLACAVVLGIIEIMDSQCISGLINLFYFGTTLADIQELLIAEMLRGCT